LQSIFECLLMTRAKNDKISWMRVIAIATQTWDIFFGHSVYVQMYFQQQKTFSADHMATINASVVQL